jgi:hypothetical protein
VRDPPRVDKVGAVEIQTLGRLLLRAAPLLNTPVAAVAASPRFGGLINRNIAVLSYTGRRTGRTFSIPVSYRRSGDEVSIAVGMPDAKTWWRNFLGDGGPLTVTLDGIPRPGHAVARRAEDGRVTVTVQLAE